MGATRSEGGDGTALQEGGRIEQRVTLVLTCVCVCLVYLYYEQRREKSYNKRKKKKKLFFLGVPRLAKSPQLNSITNWSKCACGTTHARLKMADGGAHAVV